MIRDVLGSLNYSLCAEISLITFLMIFATVSIRALLISQRETQEYAELPLQDNWETSQDAR